MSLKKIELALYSLLITNWYGLKLKRAKTQNELTKIRSDYSKKLLQKLKLTVEVINTQNIQSDKQYLVLANHRGIIDPLIVELALEKTNIFAYWVAKKELYNSPFFGMFVRNAGTVLLDREKKHMSGFFADVKKRVQDGGSIFIFPEGTRNKSNKSLIEFKDGFRIIALKNRLPILPVYIKTRTDHALGSALDGRKEEQKITIEIGKEIDYRSKENIQKLYKEMFRL